MMLVKKINLSNIMFFEVGADVEADKHEKSREEFC